MYKILTAYGNSSRNLWTIYKENNVEYSTTITTEIENKVVELLKIYNSNSIRVFNDVTYRVYVLTGGSGQYIYNEDDVFWKDNYVPELKNQSKINVIAQNDILAGDTIYAVEQVAKYLKDVEISNLTIISTSISEDDKYLLIGCGSTIQTASVLLYQISTNVNEPVVLIDTLYMDNSQTAWDGLIKSVDISHDMTHIIVGGTFTGKIKLYSFNALSGTATYLSDIKSPTNTTFTYDVNSALFSSTDKYISICCNGGNYAYLYEYISGIVTYSGIFYNAKNSTTSLSAQALHCSFNSNDTKMCLSGEFTNCAKLYGISNNKPDFITNLTGSGNSTLTGKVNYSKFSENYLFIGGTISGYCKLYSVSNNNASFISNLLNSTGGALDGEVLQIDVDHDERSVIVVGKFTNKAYQYLKSGSNVFYRGILYKDALNNIFTNDVNTANFLTNIPIVLLTDGTTQPIIAYEIDTYGWSTFDGLILAQLGTNFQYGGSIGYSTKNIFTNDVGEVIVIADVRVEY